LRELSRGDARHGSCGQGIGEARAYWLRYGEDAVFAADLRHLDRLRHKLELQRQRTLLELQDVIDRVKPEAVHEFDLWELNAEAVACDLHEAIPEGLVINAAVPEFRTAIFEGAQGVLLDEYRGFHPYTTWSTVTPHHGWELVHATGVEAVAVLGVTRAYTTRHGEGPLPTFSAELTDRLQDAGNTWNPWQGALRCGWLDLPLVRYAAAVAGPLDGIVVNHLDQVSQADCRVCGAYRGVTLTPSAAPQLSWQAQLAQTLVRAEPVLSLATPGRIVHMLRELAPVVVTSTGPTSDQRELAELPFRKRK
jgi:adenylosuccinate synthase